MGEVERFIYEYRIDKQVSEHPELVVAVIKVSVRPKTYRRIGRATWNSYTRVWFKEDLGKIVAGRVILEERNDAKALEIFIAQEDANVAQHEKYLQNAINRRKRIEALSSAIEDTEC